MRVIIAGSRNFASKNFPVMREKCDAILQTVKVECILSGRNGVIDKNTGQVVSGTDLFGEIYAALRGYTVQPYPADWDNLGKKAGPIRNALMADNADALIAFRLPGKSDGTDNMVREALKRRLKVRVIDALTGELINP